MEREPTSQDRPRRATKAAVLALALTLCGPAMAQSEMAMAAARKHAADTWIFTETISPLEEAPVIIASAQASERPDGAALQLSIQCRRGRTDLVLASPALMGKPEEQRITWAIDNGAAVTLAAGPAPAGAGLSITDDVARLLNALPPKGELEVHVAGPGGPLQGHFALAPMKAVLGRLAGPCNWPTAH